MNSMTVFDLHCDTLDRITFAGTSVFPHEKKEDFPNLLHNRAHISLEAIGTIPWIQCFAVFIPDSYKWSKAVTFFDTVYQTFQQQLSLFPERIEQAFTIQDAQAILQNKKVAAFLTVEGGSVLNGRVSGVPELARKGVKMITLTWNGKNAIGSGNETTDGLTTFGREAIRALEEHKIIVDVSHLNDAGFNDLLDIVRRPFVASHSNSRTICPHPRNLTDYQFQAICDNNGLVGINFYTNFVKTSSTKITFDDISYHIDKFLELGGEDHIALGSDYDGAEIAEWLTPCNKIGTLFDLMCNRFGQNITEKIFYKNAQNFFAENEK